MNHMCFCLYVGTEVPVPTIPYDNNDRKLNTEDLNEHEKMVAIHFTKPHHKYIGSDEGCGCGFRNVWFSDGGWPEESMIGEENYTGEREQPNHQQLYDFLKEILATNQDIELYGCWDISEPTEGQTILQLSAILDMQFYFRDRYKYTINRTEQTPSHQGIE